jgi:hypothetical protein
MKPRLLAEQWFRLVIVQERSAQLDEMMMDRRLGKPDRAQRSGNRPRQKAYCATRPLNRYLARHLYRLLPNQMPLTT